MRSLDEVLRSPDHATPTEIVLAAIEGAVPAIRRAIERGDIKSTREAAELVRDGVEQLLSALDAVTQ